MTKISVIVVTNRKNFRDVLLDDLDRQTFKDFEVIVANDADDDAFTVNDPYPITYFKPRQKKEGDVWNLNKAYNDALAKATGELLVFLQDFIWIPANGLQRFWDMYQAYPEHLITGVGHKAKEGLEGISERDDRVFGAEQVAEGNFSHWEMNWAACPRVYMPAFNEAMDRYYGGENQYVAHKAGLPVIIDRLNQCIGYSQEYCGGRPEDWETRHVNKEGRFAQFEE